GRIQYANPAFSNTHEFPLEKIIGTHIDEYALMQDIRDEIDNSLVKSKRWAGHLIGIKRDNTRFDVEVSVWGVIDSAGKMINIASIGRDISNQIRMETELRQAQKLESIGQLAAGIAHEINTPTQYVGDNTRFLQDSFNDLLKLIKKQESLVVAAKSGTLNDELVEEVESFANKTDLEYLSEEIPKAIEQSLEGIGRVTRIVSAMKEFSHPGTEEKTPIDINRAIVSTVTVARNEWKYVSEMKLELQEDIPPVPCYGGDFNQVILNLVTNAAHAIADKVGDGSKGKGLIMVKTRLDGDMAEISVSDTGTGIPENIRERIFDPFFTSKTVGRGTGQGLSIAHAVICEKLGGTLNFETEEGVGTTFFIRIPMGSSSNETDGAAE
ncbi:MAG: ATP-binding protein, partial [bacterium]